MLQFFIDVLMQENRPAASHLSRMTLTIRRLMSGTYLGGVNFTSKKPSPLSKQIGCTIPTTLAVPFALGVGLSGFIAPALADNQCGDPVSGIVTCDTPDVDNYAGGVKYTTADDLTVNVTDGVTITRDPGGDKEHAIYIIGSNGRTLSVNLEHGASINATGEQASGLFVHGDGAISVTSGADITVTSPEDGDPSDSTSGLLAQNGNENTGVGSGDITITQAANSTITATGPGGGGIYGLNYGSGSVVITSSGTVFTDGEDGVGITANNAVAKVNVSSNLANGENVTINLVGGGSVVTSGLRGVGLYSLNQGLGYALVTVDNAQISTTGDDANGIISFVNNETSTGAATILLSETSAVETSGYESSAVWVINYGLGEAILVSDAMVSTTGNEAAGLKASNINSASNEQSKITLGSSGKVTTTGTLSHGIESAHRGTGTAIVNMDAGSFVATSGDKANGVTAKSDGGVDVTQEVGAIIDVSGAEAIGVNLTAGSDATTSLFGTVSSIGEYGVGVAAYAENGSANITIGEDTIVTGGWQVNTNDQGSNSLVSAGVLIGSGNDSILTNYGTITAGSDRAVASLDRGPQSQVTIQNSGTIIGFVELFDGSNNVFNNFDGAIFDVRHFADTTGSGVADTKRVSISDFGTGSFNNNSGATIRLAQVLTDTTVDDAGYYVPTTGTDSRPLESWFYDINRSGIVQGQFNNLNNFNNAGTIDLRGSQTGNTLVISGTDGSNGVFTSDGGRLLLNTVFNEGIAPSGDTGSYSDVLIVDGTDLGAGGATTITIDRREGGGAQTPGNGILLVEVRNKDASAEGVFSLNGDFTQNGEQVVIGGAYSYSLFHNGIGDDSEDGNFYLRNVGLSPTLHVYEAYPKILLPLIDVPTLQQRIGNRYWNDPAPQEQQTIFCKDASQNYRCTITGEQASYYVDNNGTTVIQDNGVWGRIEGAHGRYEPSVSTSDARYNTDMWKLQAGIDGLFSESDNGKLIGGITAHYGHVNADITAIGSRGKVKADGYGVGGTLTWYGVNGFYADAQAQATWLNGDIDSLTTGQQLIDSNKGFGYALSLEAGQRYTINETWSLTPQAQLIYSKVNFDDFTDIYGASVSISKGESLRGRLGLAGEYQNSWRTDIGTISRFSGYGIANLYNEFLNGTRVNVSGIELSNRDDKLWAGLGAGGSYNWNDDKYSIYGEALVTTSLKNFGDSYTISGTLGLRVKW